MSTFIDATAHGFVADDAIVFTNLEGGETIIEGQVYYVLAAGLTADTFQFSETVGGAAVSWTTAITDGSVAAAPTYSVASDGIMDPPPTPTTPSAPTLTSAQVSGIVRLFITLNGTPDAPVRLWEVQVTHKFSGSSPDYSNPQTISMPENATEASIPALGNTVYAARVRVIDVFGNASAYSSDTTHTTLAGSDALAAALAALANDVSDGVITETKIANDSISTPKIKAGAITADLLAATIVLASLLKTANSGRRVEMDTFGIRLYDTDESLLVNLPTNGDPVFVKGQINADSLISQTSASLRTAVALEGNATMTLQNGVSAPTNAPTLATSVDYLLLASTPTGATGGIAYDSGAGSILIAADPATGYVAHEYNATTGALIRSIPATGSTSTVTATLGSTSHVADTADGLVGSTDSHITTPLTIPTISGATNYKITKVAVYMAGRSGTCSTRNGVWDTSNNSLRESATYTAASGGATAVGASDLHNVALSSPLSVTAGTTYRFGFRRMNTTDGSQHDKDDGAGKTTYSGDGTTADGTGWGTRSTSSKPNVYATYTYDVDTRLETAAMIGIATDGTYIYTLDANGVLWRYDRTTGAHVDHVSHAANISGTPSKAGLFFYDSGSPFLVITTTTGTGAGVYPKFVQVNPSDLSLNTTYSVSTGPTFSGTTDTFRGGVYATDPLNSGAFTWWVATTSAVYAYNFNGAVFANTSNRDFGQAATTGDGLTHSGSQFLGYDTATPTKVYKFTEWDWTTTSSTLWVSYAWYDSAGTTHETAMGPRASMTIRRRERVLVQSAAIPTGGADDPDKVRIYALQNATDSGAGAFWLQVTDALTSRYLTSYTGSGTHDGAGTAFPSGTPAELRSANATGSGGWSMKGSGAVVGPSGTSFPSSPATNQRFFRTDIQGGLWFFYDGTRWLSEKVFDVFLGSGAAATTYAATTANVAWAPISLHGGSDAWLIEAQWFPFVNSGGTALGASHKWTMALDKAVDGVNTLTNIVTASLDSGNNFGRKITTAIGALLNNGTTHVGFRYGVTKTGTPGAIFSSVLLTYRIVAT